jgi:hypothetical protein
MAKTLTAANSVIMLSVAGLFSTPQQIQGFAADDIFDTDQIDSAETAMGVDGKLSAGWVPAPIKQSFTIQADSDSMSFFETWYAAQQAVRELYIASGSIYLPAVQRKYAMRRGFLTNHSATPNAKKILQPRKFMVTWEALTSGPF